MITEIALVAVVCFALGFIVGARATIKKLQKHGINTRIDD